jgi:hypothetical protein
VKAYTPKSQGAVPSVEGKNPTVITNARDSSKAKDTSKK